MKDELVQLKNALDQTITRAQEDLEVQRNELDGLRRREVGEANSKLQSMEQKLIKTDISHH